MRAPVVIELNPVADDAHGMLLCLEAMPVDTLFLQRPDHSLDHAVLLRAVGRDELLPQAIATDQAGVVPTGEDQSVV